MDFVNAAYSPDTERKSNLKESEDDLDAISDEEEEEEDDELALLLEDDDSILEMDYLDVESLNSKKNARVGLWRRGKLRDLSRIFYLGGRTKGYSTWYRSSWII